MSLERCAYCGLQHPTALCPSTWGGSAARANLWCSYCGSNDHDVQFCPKTAGGLGQRRANPQGAYLDR